MYRILTRFAIGTEARSKSTRLRKRFISPVPMRLRRSRATSSSVEKSLSRFLPAGRGNEQHRSIRQKLQMPADLLLVNAALGRRLAIRSLCQALCLLGATRSHLLMTIITERPLSCA